MAPTITHLKRLSIALKVSQALIMDVDGVYEEETTTPVVSNVVSKQEVQLVEDNKVQDVSNDVVTKPVEELVNQNKQYDFKPKVTTNAVVTEAVFKFSIKEQPFYHNIVLTIITFILILSPLLVFKFDSSKDLLYMLIASLVTILVLLGSLFIEHHKKKQINIIVESVREEAYETKLTNKKLGMLKIIVVILSLGLFVTSYYYVRNIKGLMTDDVLKYFLIGILILSTIVKLISSLMLTTKTKVKNINSNNTSLVIMFIIDVIALVVLPMMLNIKNINISTNIVIFLVSSQFISYLVLILSSKYNSLFKFNR